MINYKSLDAVKKSFFLDPQFCKPLYDSYCFSQIPGTIQRLLCSPSERCLPMECYANVSSDCQLVCLILIDGFGWRFLEQYAEKYPFLKRFFDQGIVSKISSQFPSTTASHITCINTGLQVGESGVYEWFYYEPKLDRVIAPLLFSYAGDHQTNTLKASGISPLELYPSQTLYQELKKNKIESFVLQHASIAHSPYSEVMFHGAHQVPYTSFAGGLEAIIDISMQTELPKSYFYLYFGDIDSMGHRYGIGSPQFEEAVDRCCLELEHFWLRFCKVPKKIACLIVADHGMVSVVPEQTIYLNRELPQIEVYLKKNREGKWIIPAGSCRDFFLHVREEKIEEAKKLLESRLHPAARICKTQELIEAQLFGTNPLSDQFLQRVGNLVILPYESQAVWWYEKHHFEQHFYGAHGGLTRNEMETIFLCLTN